MTITGAHKDLVSQLAEWLRHESINEPLLLASGGSAGHIFAEAWKALSPEEQARFTISLADERYGNPGHQDSNWTLLQTLGVDLSDPRHIPVLTGASFTETATAWGDKLREYIGPSRSVIAILGIGTDSHIAGIKPNSPAAQEVIELTSAYSWDDFERITTTPAFFSYIDSAAIYMSGEAKKSVLDLLDTDLDRISYPSQFVKLAKEYTVYYQPEA